ncbi:DUF4956 domain-containing protein [Actinomycetaceae bacterium MB13-C1-2]|nr:DUF4956 domain-containing protein [Actinomycetaceae bacterium MB13-C1-2]
MELAYAAAIDLVAMVILTLALYYRRHRRRDLVTAYAVLNVGVFAVASVLGSVEIGLGVGMGLFGVLSIIRLRSTEISQYEVAYYFSALSIGLITGLDATSIPATAALVTMILVVVAIIDSQVLFSVSRQQEIRLDRAFTDEDKLRDYLGQLLGGRVTNMRVISVDLVNDSTLVDVRWSRGKDAPVEDESAEPDYFTQVAGIHQ